MKNTEIERKFLIHMDKFPYNLDELDHHIIEQAYLNTRPVVRIRRSDDEYYLTYKGAGMIERTEYNLPLNKEGYEHMLAKADGKIISKTRYLIPFGDYTIELDAFEKDYKGLYLAEVEFPTLEEANAFVAPDWFDIDVSEDGRYHNSNMALN